MRAESVPAEASYRPDIDGLRAVSVLPVMAFHAFPTYFRHGHVGVGVSSVVSGYLIAGILLRGPGPGFSHLLGFCGRRARRIFPALLVLLLTTAATGYIVLLPAEFK